MPQILQDRIIIDERDFIAGFAPLASNNNPIKIGRSGFGAGFLRDFDPFTNLPGYAFPGKTPTAVTSATSAAPNAVQVDVVQDLNAGIYAYSIGGSQINRLDVTLTAAGTLSNVSPWPHALSATGVHTSASTHSSLDFSLASVAMYQVGTNKRLFYSWSDNADWDVGVYDLASLFVDNFMSVSATTPLAGTDLSDGQGVPHPLYVAQDGLLYIGSGRQIHTYDAATGANGTFTSKYLTLPLGYEIQGFAETEKDFVAFATTAARTGRRAIAKAFFWGADRSANPYKWVFLEDDNVSAPFIYHNTIGCFTSNRSGRSVLRLYDGSRFKPIYYWSGNLPKIGGVEIQNDMILWNDAGTIYAWGSRDGEFPTAAFQIATGLGSTAGFLRSFLGGNLWASTGSGTSGGIDYFSNFAATAFFQSLTVFPAFPIGKMGKIKEVKVTFASGASAGRGLSLTLVLNSEGTVKTVFSSVTSVTASTLLRRYIHDTAGVEFPTFEMLKANLVWDAGSGSAAAPGVSKIEIFFDVVDFPPIP